jgi:hypothetical protein
LTIDDPGAYTSAWKTVFNVRFTSGVESVEFICQDGNQAYEPMVGSMGKVDRSSPFVPEARTRLALGNPGSWAGVLYFTRAVLASRDGRVLRRSPARGQFEAGGSCRSYWTGQPG